MADEPTPNDGGDPGDGFKPITTQDELNAVLKDRIARERSKFADYKDLQVKAAKLDEIEQANKTEAEKTAERIATLERELEATRTTALRSRIQAKFGIDDEDADLFLTATDEDTLTKQAQRLADRVEERKKSGAQAPLAGRTPTKTAGDDGMREFARALVRRD
jgi:hypothetical protein